VAVPGGRLALAVGVGADAGGLRGRLGRGEGGGAARGWVMRAGGPRVRRSSEYAPRRGVSVASGSGRPPGARSEDDIDDVADVLLVGDSFGRLGRKLH